MKFLALVLAIICFVSFGWAIKSLFQRQSAVPIPMRWLNILGISFFVLHLIAIWLSATYNVGSVIGIALYSAAFMLFWWSVPYARREGLAIAFSQSQSRSILKSGPYKFIRHPFYLSYLMFWIAGVFVSQNVVLLISVVVMGAFYISALKSEEAELLKSRLGYEYAEYRERTGALWPRLWRTKA
ncbi:MAG: isoprenylcysteine carboxylmethyltransferase family protein [Rhodospirillaceae bacterium]|nr:isoprenylcysteine carboxylmethyltransferase family protein [Rhodospirillaceae bacterium]